MNKFIWVLAIFIVADFTFQVFLSQVEQNSFANGYKLGYQASQTQLQLRKKNGIQHSEKAGNGK